MGGAPSYRATYAVSESGVLAYQGAIGEQSTLVLLDRTGKELAVLSDSAEFSYVQLSPNGRQAAVSVIDNASGNRDLWLYRDFPDGPSATDRRSHGRFRRRVVANG